MNKLLLRSITGAIFVVNSVAAIFFGEYTYLIFIMFVCSAALYEFYKILGISGKPVNSLSGIISAFVILAGVYAGIKTGNALWFLLLLSPLLILPIASFISSRNQILKSSAFTFIGLIYIVLPLALSLDLAFSDSIYEFRVILVILVFIWVFDSMAYFTGSLLGKTKMAPKISPKKTWEGFAGGAILTIAFSFLMWQIFPSILLPYHIAISIVVVIFGTPGDLIESYLKRKANLKDSGNILPGHGGILDRFDSFFIVIPFVYLVLYLIT